jgi:competence CoiA-like predicted nuclease
MEIPNVLLNGEPVMRGDERRKTVYTCADCKTDLMYKHGKIKVPHFAHYSTIECQSLRQANDYLTHKTAILKMQTDLVGGIEITSKCGCKSIHKGNAVLEHPVSNGRADLALLEPLVLFEICHTHKTEIRDGLWYEMKALEVLNGVYTCMHECSGCFMRTIKQRELKAFRCKEKENMRLVQEAWDAEQKRKRLEWDAGAPKREANRIQFEIEATQERERQQGINRREQERERQKQKAWDAEEKRKQLEWDAGEQNRNIDRREQEIRTKVFIEYERDKRNGIFD